MDVDLKSTLPLKAFQDAYGIPAEQAVIAPGRINLIGEHVDYHMGKVMPIAIDRHISFLLASRQDSKVVLISSQAGHERVELDCQNSSIWKRESHWSDYIKGVAQQLLRSVPPSPPIQGLNIFIDSTLDSGSGMSSSAALETGIASCLGQHWGVELTAMQIAQIAHQAEHDFVGVPCGIMDQFACALSREEYTMLLDCRDQSIEHLPLNLDPYEIWVSNCGVKHALVDGEYEKRQQQCHEALQQLQWPNFRHGHEEQENWKDLDLDPILKSRARHVLSEMDRVEKAKISLQQGQLNDFGRLLYESHQSLSQDYDVSCRELDLLVKWSQVHQQRFDILGSRMTGAGFGGSVIHLIHRDHAEQAMLNLKRDYQEHTGIAIDPFRVKPMAGVHRLDLNEAVI